MAAGVMKGVIVRKGTPQTRESKPESSKTDHSKLFPKLYLFNISRTSTYESNEVLGWLITMLAKLPGSILGVL